MTQQEILQWCLDNKLILKVNEEYFPIDKKTGKVKGGRCQNFPSNFNGLSLKQMYNNFMNLCEIPSLSTGNFIYSLREESVGSIAVLKAILEDPTIDFLILVQKIKAFYKLTGKTAAQYVFSKFLEKGTWRSIYEAESIKSSTNLSNTIIR